MTEARPRSCEAPSRRVFPARRRKTRCRHRPPDAADSGPDRLLIWHTPGAEADRLCFLRPVQNQFVDMCDDADNALEVPLHRRRRETHVAPVSNLVSVVYDAVDNGAVLPGKEAANIPFPCLVEITEGRDNSFLLGFGFRSCLLENLFLTRLSACMRTYSFNISLRLFSRRPAVSTHRYRDQWLRISGFSSRSFNRSKWDLTR